MNANVVDLKLKLVYYGSINLKLKLLPQQHQKNVTTMDAYFFFQQIVKLMASEDLNHSEIGIFYRGFVKYIHPDNRFRCKVYSLHKNTAFIKRTNISSIDLENNVEYDISMETLVRIFQEITEEYSVTGLTTYPIIQKNTYIYAFPFFIIAQQDRNGHRFYYQDSYFKKHFHSKGFVFDSVLFVPTSETKYAFPVDFDDDDDDSNWQLLLIKPHQLFDNCLYCLIMWSFVM